jgi:hypothetical protein
MSVSSHAIETVNVAELKVQMMRSWDDFWASVDGIADRSEMTGGLWEN